VIALGFLDCFKVRGAGGPSRRQQRGIMAVVCGDSESAIVSLSKC